MNVLLRRSATLILLLTVTAGYVQGQSPAANDFSVVGNSAIITLANNPAVQKELGADEATIAKLRALREELSATINKEMAAAGLSMDTVRTASAKDRPAKMEELKSKGNPIIRRAKETLEPQLAKILSAEQHQRLRGIYWQTQGLNALYEPEVVKELKYPPEQFAKIREIRAAANAARREVMSGGGDPRERIAKAKELTTKEEADVLQALTEEQRAAFNKLKGKRVDLSPKPTPKHTPEEQSQLEQARQDNEKAVGLHREGKIAEAIELTS